MKSFLLATDLLLTGFTIGVTAWHFFLQSPLMFKTMGKEKFVPIMMQLTRLWNKTMFVSSSSVLLASLLLVRQQEQTFVSLNVYLVGLGWLAMAINRFVVVPRALRAGAQSVSERKGDNNRDVKEFAVSGGGKTSTKNLHQTVVVFVLIMVVALLAHSFDLTSAALS